MRDLDRLWSRDFALLRLKTTDIFPAAPVYQGTETSLPAGTPVALAAILPEGYPHEHLFTWGSTFPEEVLQPGHSGSPIFHQGTIFALIASGGRDLNVAHGRPGVAQMREVLDAAGLEFVLRPCDGKEP
jgi:hypothetical protein